MRPEPRPNYAARMRALRYILGKDNKPLSGEEFAPMAQVLRKSPESLNCRWLTFHTAAIHRNRQLARLPEAGNEGEYINARALGKLRAIAVAETWVDMPPGSSRERSASWMSHRTVRVRTLPYHPNALALRLGVLA